VHKAIMDDFVSLHDYDIYVAGRFEMAGAAREEFKVLGAEPSASSAMPTSLSDHGQPQSVDLPPYRLAREGG
jgi:NAD(P)H-flavin reductase